jgi:hypothetical protein
VRQNSFVVKDENKGDSCDLLWFLVFNS